MNDDQHPDHRSLDELGDDELLDALADALAAPERDLPDERVAALRAQAERRGVVAALNGRPATPRPPDQLGDRRARRSRRDARRTAAPTSRRTVLVGGVAASVGAALGVAGVLALGTGDDDGGDAELAVPTQPVTFDPGPDGTTVAGRTIDHTWGMELLLDVAGLPAEATYEVRFATAGGPVGAGGFRAVEGVTMHCRFNGTALRSEVTDVDVVDTATGTPVLHGTIA